MAISATMQFTCQSCGALNDPPTGPGAECEICGAALQAAAEAEPVLAKLALRKVRRRRDAPQVAGLGASITPMGDMNFDDQTAAGVPSLESLAPSGGIVSLDSLMPPAPVASAPDPFAGMHGNSEAPAAPRSLGSLDQGIGAPQLMGNLEDLNAEPIGVELFGEPSLESRSAGGQGVGDLFGAAPLAGAPAPSAFTFGGDEVPAVASIDDLFGSLNANIDDFTDESPTRVVDLERNMPIAAVPQKSGWRVRSERGVVYELMTIDAVVAWLDGKTDLMGVQVARGDGPFQEVQAFAELAGRVASSAPPASPSSMGASSASEELSLDIAPERAAQQRARAQRSAGPPPSAASSTSEARARAPGAQSKARGDATRESKPRPSNPVGFGLVLWSLIAAGVLTGAVIFAGLKFGWIDPPPVEASLARAQAGPSLELEAAIALYDSAKYAAAQAQLEQLARTEQDPRVHRYLALTYFRTNRQPEARAALEEYRRGMLTQSGAHGRQVREVRD